ncbi:aldo/keto reductase [Colletotrichum scovillei]|uniref:aldo/keto reductase n=1 Tax=Colletotrichum scovillei TaxID=1209932 RepID=UPI0015C3AAB5|nr:aldo/keto reductase [Colletotrichum scovillei]KAF4775341.1 aldo/keto reductase [Colletotrichum scovillei]
MPSFEKTDNAQIANASALSQPIYFLHLISFSKVQSHSTHRCLRAPFPQHGVRTHTPVQAEAEQRPRDSRAWLWPLEDVSTIANTSNQLPLPTPIASAPEQAEEVTTEALRVGYRHVDSAASYKNEAGAGAAIRGVKDIPRSDVFFTSKVRYINYDDAEDQVRETLEKTGLDYIDLMLLHCPYGGSEGRKGAWKALVEAQEAGLVKSIGVSNYGVHHLDELETHIKELEEERGGKGKGGAINVAQYEIHPWCARNDIVQWLQKRNVAIEAYSPLVRGERWGDKTLKALAEKYGKSEAQILLRWSLQKGYIPLPKSVTPTRILDNTKIYDFQLTDEDVKNLETDEYAPVCWDPTVSPLDGPKSG